MAIVLGVVALPACSSGPPKTYRIAILRAVTGASAESKLYDGLSRAGVPRDRIVVIGGKDASEAYVDVASATAAVRRWVRQGVDAIVALSTTSAQVARDNAASVPVLILSNDPSATGLVRNERTPEGHVTGMSYRVPADRTLALITDAYPSVHHVGCLYPPADPAAVPAQRDLVAAAKDLTVSLTCEQFTGTGDAPAAAQRLVGTQVGAIVVVNSPTSSRATPAIVQALASTHVPVLTNTPNPGAELVLSPDASSVYVDLGRQLARVLRGAKVADVPVQDPGRFLLIVNQALATQNGHTIPANVLREATQVIT